MMKMKTKKQIADEAKQLAYVLSGTPTSTPESLAKMTLVERTLRQLAWLIHDLATVGATTRTCARPKCSDPATVVTGLCVAHSVSAMGDSIDRTVERKRKKK
jgi:hypothetical protein